MKNVLFIGLILVLFSSCYNDKADKLYPQPIVTTCDTTNATYSAKVKPIIAKNCAISGCHDGVSGAPFMTLGTSYSGLKITVNNGQLLQSINHTGGLSFMPKYASKLSDCDISVITAWVNAGAQDN
jgi:mono/diheme cytochrome c family protein